MLRAGYDLSANLTSSSLSTKMAARSECCGVLRQLVRLLSQSDHSYEIGIGLFEEEVGSLLKAAAQ